MIHAAFGVPKCMFDIPPLSPVIVKSLLTWVFVVVLFVGISVSFLSSPGLDYFNFNFDDESFNYRSCLKFEAVLSIVQNL